MTVITPVESLPVEVTRIHPDAVLPYYATGESAGFDLTIIEPVAVAQGEVKLVRTGLVVTGFPGYMLYITGRSSTPRRHGVQVITGIVDRDYCGIEDELKIQVAGLRPTGAKIPAGTAIAQGIFVAVRNPSAFSVLHSNDRKKVKNRGGFGSTDS